jgi:hypothetical protein
MIMSLVLALFVGNAYHMPGLANTATTFMVMYGLEKACDAGRRCRFAHWTYVFLGCGCLYNIAMWLHQHPGHIVSLMTP